MSDPALTAPAALSEAAPRPRNRRRQAAMIVQLLINEGAPLALSALPDDLQLALTRELATLRLVDRASLDAAIRDFTAELDAAALATPGTLDAALSALDGRISAAATARLRDEETRRRGNDPWPALAALDADDLLPILRAEADEIGALLLSKLPTPRAAALLSRLPGDAARRITFAVSRVTATTPELLDRIGRALATAYCARALPAFEDEPVTRIGAILNSAPAETRDGLLEQMGAEDADFAADLRRAIFTFADIPARLGITDVPKILRGLDAAALATALGGAGAAGGDEAAAAEFLLDNMSRRMADQLREEIEELGRVRKSDAEEAMRTVVAAILAARDAGEITLIAPEEDDTA